MHVILYLQPYSSSSSFYDLKVLYNFLLNNNFVCCRADIKRQIKNKAKGAVIFNAGYRGGRIFYTNCKIFLPRSRKKVNEI